MYILFFSRISLLISYRPNTACFCQIKIIYKKAKTLYLSILYLHILIQYDIIYLSIEQHLVHKFCSETATLGFS